MCDSCPLCLQAGGAGFNTALLTAVARKLRSKLVMSVMEQQAAWSKELQLLLQQAGAPAHLALH